MLAPRALQQSLRTIPLRSALVPGLVARSVWAAQTQVRYATTQPLKPDEGHEILVQQRLKRPVSPHLSIYKAQISWVPSIAHRVTGAVVSGSFYIFGFGYLVAPLFGWHLESHALVATMAGLSIASKVAIKSFFAVPFVFHSLNGVRHLMWDMGSGITNRQVSVSGWSLVAATAVGSLALVLM